jgi:DNA mismatch repair protein MutL
LADIIHLLPDHIANQIAAGEVIQRPASAVKELLENAIDAGATEIQLIINDAGKALIQVIDNGKGMSDTDVRMAFERHATSKIARIEDLFHISTMGFRGEALASIAAVAQVEVKTKRTNDAVGSYLEIENSTVTKQEVIACANGTSIAMKNLFFNVPARRNFLKSNTTELRNIIDEFTRVAMAFPEVAFTCSSNGQQVYNLTAGTLKQRILQLMGNNYATKLVAVKEQTDYLNISGFVGKPEAAKKTRGDQYIFVNNRFIKSAYLNHAISNAFEDMLQRDSYPSYFLFLQLDPQQVDINVHPTKQEIKFEDEKLIYAFVSAAVKHSLAQFSIAPSLDFDLDPTIQKLDAVSKPFTQQRQQEVYSSSIFQGFTQKNQAHKIEHSGNLKNWETFFEQPQSAAAKLPIQQNFQKEIIADGVALEPTLKVEKHQVLQIAGTYILYEHSGGYTLVHQQYAHQRIIYNQLIACNDAKKIAIQQSLFPETIELSIADAVLLQELLPELNILGYHIEPFGNSSFVLHGTPADLKTLHSKRDIELLLEHYKNSNAQIKLSTREKLAMSMCWQQSIKPHTVLQPEEMIDLVTKLHNALHNALSPFGKTIQVHYTEQQLQKTFS